MKRKALIILLAIVTVILAIAIAMFVYITWVGTPTKGPRIGKYEGPRTALIVVDLQEDFTGKHAVAKMRSPDAAVKAAGDLVAAATTRDQPVAYIRAIFKDPGVRLFMGGLSAPDQPGSRMDARLPSLPSIKTFTKTRGDAFSNPDLDAWLRENRVNHVIIVGLDAFYCVDNTIHGALNRGYKVTAVLAAITTGTDKDINTIAAQWRKAGVEVR